MCKIAKTIQEGAMSFLYQEYTYMMMFIVVFSVILFFFTGIPTTVAFVVGAVTSMICGYIGMLIAVYTNVRTTHQCWKDLKSGFDVAIQGGCVMGLSLVSIGVLDLFLLILAFKKFFVFGGEQEMYEAIAGYGLGGSTVALFGRVGGGIYTKAADVGADLSGKNDYGLEEDDYRNPACIADNVGDNVGDIAGMGADLFGSFAESTCAALVLAAASSLKADWASLMYPLLISSTGIVVGMVTLLVQNMLYPVKDAPDVEKALKGVLVISTILMTPVVCLLSKHCLPDTFDMGEAFPEVQSWHCSMSIMLGLWSGLVIGFVTEYYLAQLLSRSGDRGDAEAVCRHWHHLRPGPRLPLLHRASDLPRHHHPRRPQHLRHVRRRPWRSRHVGDYDYGPHDRCLRPHLRQRWRDR
jgi:inorganic pyrophosphatase